MRPVFQRDDCLAACIASVLEIDLDELPDIHPDDEDRLERWWGWLRAEGWESKFLDVPPLDPARVPSGLWIAVYGDRQALRKQVDDYVRSVRGQPLEHEGEYMPPGHAVVCRGTRISWNPWGILTDADDLGELLAGFELVPSTDEGEEAE